MLQIRGSKTGSTDKFMESYRSCCSVSKTRLKVKTIAGGRLLDFNADRLETEDWRPLFTALRCDRNLHTLAIKSEYSGKLWSTSIAKIKPSLYKSDVMKELVESMVSCMKTSKILSTVNLQSLPLSRSHVELLAEGVRACLSLQNLLLTKFALTDDGLLILYRAIYSHVGLTTIDFSDCGLTADGAQTIAKIVRTQRLARFDETWKHSLRYRETNQELQPGLRRITLNDNPLIGDDGFLTVSHELMDDLWVEAVYFQNCGLTDISAEEAVKLLTTNETINVLDVNRNDKIKGDLKTQIKQILRGRERSGSAATERCVTAKTETADNRQKTARTKTPMTTSRGESVVKKNSSQCISSDLTYTKGIADPRMSVELRYTKQALDHMKRYLAEEKRKCEDLENAKREQKIKLADKYTKEWKKRKEVEKERDKLKQGLNSLLSNGQIPTKRDFSKPNTSLYTWKNIKNRNRTFKRKQDGGGDRLDCECGCENGNSKQVLTKSEKYANKILQKIMREAEPQPVNTSKKKTDKSNANTAKNTLAKGSARDVNFNNQQNDSNESETRYSEKDAGKHPRDMSPISRSQWIFKEIRMNKLQKQKQLGEST